MIFFNASEDTNRFIISCADGERQSAPLLLNYDISDGLHTIYIHWHKDWQSMFNVQKWLF